MIAFIDDHREAYGVEPTCKVMPIAPSTYHTRIAQHPLEPPYGGLCGERSTLFCRRCRALAACIE
jgi:hypothetical protein